MLCKTIVFCAVFISTLAAEIPLPYDQMNKHTLLDTKVKTDGIKTHAVNKDDNKSDGHHPIYVAEEHKNGGRANIKPVRPLGPVVKYEDMLADQPAVPSTEVKGNDQQAIPNYGYAPNPVEVAYPDIPYAPGYGYDTGYAPSNNYDIYSNNLGNYLLEPDTSTFGLLWSQVPDARTIVNYVGRSIVWVINSILVIVLGSLLTMGFCSYTSLCTFTFHGVGPIREEMRALISPERLEKISNAAEFVKTAIDKYQKIQDVSDPEKKRPRRGIFY